MFVIAESATTVVRLDDRFGPAQVSSVEEVLAMFRPVGHVIIDFANVRDADTAAVATLARALSGLAGSRVSFRGLSRHLRRLLRYVGVDVDAPPAVAAGAAAGAS